MELRSGKLCAEQHALYTSND